MKAYFLLCSLHPFVSFLSFLAWKLSGLVGFRTARPYIKYLTPTISGPVVGEVSVAVDVDLGLIKKVNGPCEQATRKPCR